LESLAARLAALGVLAVTISVLAVAWQGSKTPSLAGTTLAEASPGQITKTSKTTRHFEYVLVSGEIDVYDSDRAHRLVQRIRLPQLGTPRGAAAHPASGMLYVSYEGSGGVGSMLAYDLLRGRLVWQRDYDISVDSIAILPNGKTLYAPAGESSGDGRWYLVNPKNGAVKGSIMAGAGAHNTVVSLDGKLVFLAGVDDRYTAVVSTATNRIVRKIGPLISGGRPFTINGRQTLLFSTGRGLLGFQVSSITSGRVLHTVTVPGYTYDPSAFNNRTPNHGISMSPNEREIYLIDTPNGYVHVFDIRGVPAAAPRYVASIKMAHAPPNDGWLRHSRNGRYVYVGRAGDVIDTRTRKIVAYLPPLEDTAHFIEIDWRRGRPVSTTSRYGLGYVVPR
jgi:DNA-binding beta-propeller fold protein YncE